MTNHEIWQSVMAEFELKVSKANFTTWFHGTGISEFTHDGNVTVCVPTLFAKSWLEKKYHAEIVKILETVTHQRIKKVIYKVENPKNIEEKEMSFGSTQPQSTQHTQSEQLFSAPTVQPEFRPIPTQFGLNPKYTFDTFVVGKNNELAHAAAQAVARRPGEAYNPLFIYGGVGLGKTHLLQAIANEMLIQNPNLRIMYVNTEKFMSEFILALKEKRMDEFKQRYRTTDLLLIDDIQFIGGKEQTQEEFFHTFNELHQNYKQIVLTADRPPKAIPALEDRLRSRFEWGMIVDVTLPDLETRVAILQTKCQERHFPVDEDLLQLIASSIQSNIRELEGALNKVIAYHQLKNISPDKESVKAVLSTLENRASKKSTTPKEIIETVAKFFDISLDELQSKGREKRVSYPRQIIMYLLRSELHLSYPAIGDEMGGRDHTTAIHADEKIKKDVENDPKVKQDVDLIKQRIYTDAV